MPSTKFLGYPRFPELEFALTYLTALTWSPFHRQTTESVIQFTYILYGLYQLFKVKLRSRLSLSLSPLSPAVFWTQGHLERPASVVASSTLCTPPLAIAARAYARSPPLPSLTVRSKLSLLRDITRLKPCFSKFFIPAFTVACARLAATNSASGSFSFAAFDISLPRRCHQLQQSAQCLPRPPGVIRLVETAVLQVRIFRLCVRDQVASAARASA